VGGGKDIQVSSNPMHGTKTCYCHNMIEDEGMNFEDKMSQMPMRSMTFYQLKFGKDPPLVVIVFCITNFATINIVGFDSKDTRVGSFAVVLGMDGIGCLFAK
jgi:hypothetical protein